MAKKDVGVIIQFDDVDYSDEERDLLWGQFFMLLAETAQEVKEKKNAECVKFPDGRKRKTKEVAC